MNLEALQDHRFPAQRVSYGHRDSILYSLSVGVGADPLDANQLRFAYEQNLEALPTMAAVLAHPGAWIANPAFQVDFFKLLHGEQNLIVHRALPAKADIEASYRVPAVVDKGAGKGALVYFEKRLTDVASGEKLCTVLSTLFLRGDGGCGSFGIPPPALPAAPVSPVEFSVELKTSISAALLYRLNGDLNPIHVDPSAAAKAGFDQPILHGLCTYGVAGYLLVKTVCGSDPTKLRSLGVRFSSPVFPGETLRIEGSRRAEGVHFQASVPERNLVVLSQGFAALA
jgi:acyl dehydratase